VSVEGAEGAAPACRGGDGRRHRPPRRRRRRADDGRGRPDVVADAAVAIDGGVIVAIGPAAELAPRYRPRRTLDARGHALLPGLVDSYGHAGHALVRGLFHPDHGWPAGRLYFEATTRAWWAAEAALAAAERLRFGVTTGQSIVGATPARMDDLAFTEANVRAYLDAGLRLAVGVGPPDPLFPHLEAPWSVRREVDGVWTRHAYTYEGAVEHSVEAIERWHGAGGGRVQVQIAPPYLLGRHVAHGRLAGHPLPTAADAPRMLAHALEMRAIADRHGVRIHTHLFRGSVAFARRHFGEDAVAHLLRDDVVVAHGNGFDADEIAVLGERRVHLATVAHTHEDLWYGVAPIVELLEAGANVAIATDGAAPYASYDLLREPSRATWHQWVAQRSQHALPPGKALRMITIDAARALGLGDVVGSLEVGKRADLIAIDLRQPHLTPWSAGSLPYLLVQYATGRDVAHVVADGEVLLEGGRYLRLDVEAVVADAAREAEAAFARVGVEAYRTPDRASWRAARYGAARRGWPGRGRSASPRPAAPT
jgi:5-methylthioadenosine/S-adenosylhomocysteine deaminase